MVTRGYLGAVRYRHFCCLEAYFLLRTAVVHNKLNAAISRPNAAPGSIWEGSLKECLTMIDLAALHQGHQLALVMDDESGLVIDVLYPLQFEPFEHIKDRQFS